MSIPGLRPRRLNDYRLSYLGTSLPWHSEKFQFCSAIAEKVLEDRYSTHSQRPYYLQSKNRLKSAMDTESKRKLNLINVGDTKFAVRKEFVNQWSKVQPPFGFNGLGELVYRRTYSRFLDDDSDKKEEWFQTVERVVNGTYTMQKEWILAEGNYWDELTAQREAEEMYKRIFTMKFLPPGRGLWAMGSKITTERRLFAALNNCAFVSTIDIESDPSSPFCFLMDASMLGVGVGFDTKGANKVIIVQPGTNSGLEESLISSEVNYIDDSREGWVCSVQILLNAYLTGTPLPTFDYSRIRKAGTPIRGFGGVCQGFETLKNLHDELRQTLEANLGQYLSVRVIVDIMNQIGKCVVAGNVRRSAEIAFGDPFDNDYVNLKDYSINPDRSSFGWLSNNSVMCPIGMDYTDVCKRVVKNGEPGFAWIENMQKYGRMNGSPNYRDIRAMGGNPCLEQTLESYEMCCLVETFPFKHESLDDFLVTLRYAFAYAKTVTLGMTNWTRTNDIMTRNRRIGCSMSGLAQFVSTRGLSELHKWCEAGYSTIQKSDADISTYLGVQRSIKTTSIKPSGTVSLLAGATPGMHYPESRYYIRRVRLPIDSELIEPLKNSNFKIEVCVSNSNSVVVEIPIDAGEGVRTQNDVCMWEQLSFAAFLQRHWADNQVSCTVSFDPRTEAGQLPHALNYFQYQLKGVSFLPRIELGAYPQMPYEAITEEEYLELVKQISPLNFTREGQSRSGRGLIESIPDRYCDSDSCSMD